MVIYIDVSNKCYSTAAEGLRAFETELITDSFNGKCAAFIEGHIYVPTGETWTRSDGVLFEGEMISPWKPYADLAKAQAEYENEQLKVRVSGLEAELAAAKILLGVE